jgi:hypothetical protein
MLLEQFEAFWQYEEGSVRTQLSKLEQAAALPHAVIISGLRRSGGFSNASISLAFTLWSSEQGNTSAASPAHILRQYRVSFLDQLYCLIRSQPGCINENGSPFSHSPAA